MVSLINAGSQLRRQRIISCSRGRGGRQAAAGSQEVIAVSQRNEMMAGQSIQRGSWFVYRTGLQNFQLGAQFGIFSEVGRYWQILWREIFFVNIFQRWKILADIVRRRQSTPLSWGLVCKPQDWNATQLLLRQ